MIVCFNCTAETKDELDRLVKIGSFRDHSEAIAAAVRNQLLMEKEVAETGAIIIGTSPATSSASSRGTTGGARAEKVPPKGAALPPKPTPRRKENGSTRISRNGAATPPASVPALFQKEGFPQEAPTGLAELPTDMWALGQVVPLDRWVLGQQNRLLPAKVNARALLRLFLESPKGLPIALTAERIATEAAVLGDYLSALDEARNVSRDDALATAFPTTAEDAEKGHPVR